MANRKRAPTCFADCDSRAQQYGTLPPFANGQSLETEKTRLVEGPEKKFAQVQGLQSPRGQFVQSQTRTLCCRCSSKQSLHPCTSRTWSTLVSTSSLLARDVSRSGGPGCPLYLTPTRRDTRSATSAGSNDARRDSTQRRGPRLKRPPGWLCKRPGESPLRDAADGYRGRGRCAGRSFLSACR